MVLGNAPLWNQGEVGGIGVIDVATSLRAQAGRSCDRSHHFTYNQIAR